MKQSIFKLTQSYHVNDPHLWLAEAERIRVSAYHHVYGFHVDIVHPQESHEKQFEPYGDYRLEWWDDLLRFIEKCKLRLRGRGFLAYVLYGTDACFCGE